RSDALEDHDPDKGDDAWVYGCKCYRRSCVALTKLAAELDWLEVSADRQAFTLSINKIEMKFFAGEDEAPTARVLSKAQRIKKAPVPEATSFPFYDQEKESEGENEWFWLIQVSRHGDGTASKIAFFQTNASGEVR